MDMITTYCGTPLDEMSKDELIKALIETHETMKRHMDDILEIRRERMRPPANLD